MKDSKQFSQILIYLPPTDMRKQVAGLAVMVESVLKENPFDRSLFIFCNKRRDIIKAIYFDRAGFCLWMKKLDKERFPWVRHGNGSYKMDAKDLDLLLDGVDVFGRHKTLNFESMD